MIFKSAKSGTNINIITMKAGAWYVAGFVVAFVYFYVYAVNYIRGVRSDDDAQLKTDLEHLPQFLEQFSSSREARNAEALWPLAMRSGSLKSNPNGKTFTKRFPKSCSDKLFGSLSKKNGWNKSQPSQYAPTGLKFW